MVHIVHQGTAAGAREHVKSTPPFTAPSEGGGCWQHTVPFQLLPAKAVRPTQHQIQADCSNG